MLPFLLKLTESFARIAEFLMKSKVAAAALAIVISTALIPALFKLLKLLALNPYLLGLTALFGALYLIIDDIAAYFQGGRSGIGYLLYFIDELKQSDFFSNTVPKWIELLAEAADKLFKWWEGQKKKAVEHNEVFANNTAEELRRITGSPFIQAVKNDDGSFGYACTIPKAEPYLNGINQNIDNSNRTTTITQTNNINSQQPARDIYDELFYLRNAFSPQ